MNQRDRIRVRHERPPTKDAKLRIGSSFRAMALTRLFYSLFPLLAIANLLYVLPGHPVRPRDGCGRHTARECRPDRPHLRCRELRARVLGAAFAGIRSGEEVGEEVGEGRRACPALHWGLPDRFRAALTYDLIRR